MSKITPEQRGSAEDEIFQEAKMIKYDTREYPLETIVDMFESGELYIPSDYQWHNNWEYNNRRSRFIESCLLGVPLPSITVLKEDYPKSIDATQSLKVIDGVQRLETLIYFLNDQWDLGKLTILKAVNGFKFSDLTPIRQRKFKQTSIRTIVLENPKVARDIFERINGI